jgi:hypothetical protein
VSAYFLWGLVAAPLYAMVLLRYAISHDKAWWRLIAIIAATGATACIVAIAIHISSVYALSHSCSQSSSCCLPTLATGDANLHNP